jgi:preprotein translocase subunit SecE
VARNRKRAKERRARRPAPVVSAHANGEDVSPIAHAAPDVELAEAQLALGRPELTDGSPTEAELEEAEEELSVDEQFGAGPNLPGILPERPDIESGELEQIEAPVPEARARAGNRLINFLQGSWRELQRVQWPDRRQVMQATGVVIGFVIVAGVFLGVADFLAGKLVNFILK